MSSARGSLRSLSASMLGVVHVARQAGSIRTFLPLAEIVKASVVTISTFEGILLRFEVVECFLMVVGLKL